jgi:lysyl-tRNA synthetase class II
MPPPIASGAAARPSTTHHTALDIALYLRIAPELYLNRLLVGGFERVYEINRNFRNEGISTRHNPEFTMLEFYTAYKDVNWMMDFCEEMIRQTITPIVGGTTVTFGETEIDFGGKFRRLAMREAVAERRPADVESLGDDEAGARRLIEMFEESVEADLIQPTFITDFPKSVSPLSKAAPENSAVATNTSGYCAASTCVIIAPEDQPATTIRLASTEYRPRTYDTIDMIPVESLPPPRRSPAGVATSKQPSLRVVCGNTAASASLMPLSPSVTAIRMS